MAKTEVPNWKGKDVNLTAEQQKNARRLTGGGRSQAISDAERMKAMETQVDINMTKWLTSEARDGKGMGGSAVGPDGKPITGTVKQADGSSVQYVRGKRIGILPKPKPAPAAPRQAAPRQVAPKAATVAPPKAPTAPKATAPMAAMSTRVQSPPKPAPGSVTSAQVKAGLDNIDRLAAIKQQRLRNNKVRKLSTGMGARVLNELTKPGRSAPPRAGNYMNGNN